MTEETNDGCPGCNGLTSTPEKKPRLTWEEILFAVAGFVFTLALLPAIISPDTHFDRNSSLMTFTGLLAMIVALVRWKKYLPAIGSALNALSWLILAIFRS